MTKSQLSSFNWKIAGKAGEGVMVVAKLMTKICKRQGLNAFNYLEYPSLIKGGHQTGQVFASFGTAKCQKRNLDLLVTLGPAGLVEHEKELTQNSLIIYNQNAGPLDKSKYLQLKSQMIEVPFITLAKQTAGTVQSANMGVLGISVYFLGLNIKIAQQVIKDEFVGKTESVIEDNLKTFMAGFKAGQKLGQPIRQINKKP
ncbi:MAG: 2-oxoacid:acceptor oxidoreductase family protein, partial [Patescibacteria group bacterium]